MDSSAHGRLVVGSIVSSPPSRALVVLGSPGAECGKGQAIVLENCRIDMIFRVPLIAGAPLHVVALSREAEEALTEGGDLEKDQLGRVTLLGFIRWCRLREKRRQEAKANLRNPPPPWKERLRSWRKVM